MSVMRELTQVCHPLAFSDVFDSPLRMISDFRQLLVQNCLPHYPQCNCGTLVTTAQRAARALRCHIAISNTRGLVRIGGPDGELLGSLGKMGERFCGCLEDDLSM